MFVCVPYSYCVHCYCASLVIEEVEESFNVLKQNYKNEVRNIVDVLYVVSLLIYLFLF